MGNFSDEQKRASIARARALLAELDRSDALVEAAVDAAASDDALTAPATWGQKSLSPYGIASFDPHSGRLEKWKREGEEINRRREQARLERQQQERQDREQRARSSADWDEWVTAKVNEINESKLFNEAQRELLAMLLAGVRKEMQAAVGELRAELNVQRAADSAGERDGPVLDLPVVRRNGSQR